MSSVRRGGGESPCGKSRPRGQENGRHSLNALSVYYGRTAWTIARHTGNEFDKEKDGINRQEDAYPRRL
jgi:hypothetical protein